MPSSLNVLLDSLKRQDREVASPNEAREMLHLKNGPVKKMIQKIGIIGAGTMGQSIATCFSLHGYDVHLFDVSEDRLLSVKSLIHDDLSLMASEGVFDSSLIEQFVAKVALFTNLAETVKDRDYVIEAVPEILDLKQDLFNELDKRCPERTILATNTSSLPLEQIMKKLSVERKKKTLVCHWYNPAHLMPIAEISCFGNTTEETYDQVAKLYHSIGKQTVKVLRDVPGLVANRIQQAVAREVFSLIENEVATAKDIDKALKFGPAFRYATTGQLEIADFGGLDIWAIVGDNLLKEMDNSQEANPILKNKIEEGKLGFKSGEGFFNYKESDKSKIKSQYYKKLITQMKVSKKYI